MSFVGLPQDEPLYNSELGTPVMGNLVIEDGSYLDMNGNAVNYYGITIDTVEFTVRNTKNIKEEEVDGLDETVKEFINGGSFIISVKGIITGGNGTYPTTQVSLLAKILKARAAITVSNSWMLNTFGISLMVVTEYELNKLSGDYSQQPFSFTAKSDKPAILFIVQ